MLKGLRRWLDLGGRLDGLDELLRASRKRQDILADELEHMEAKVQKLRGRLTGGLRGLRNADQGDGQGEGTPQSVDELNALIRAGRYRGVQSRRVGPNNR